MKYITLNDLNNTIRKNIWKIPRDVDFVIGINRSGLLAATQIAEYLNLPLIDDGAWVKGVSPGGGNRLALNVKKINTNRVLVVDDTSYSGGAMKDARKELSKIEGFEYIYVCVYLEGEKAREGVDIYLEDITSELKDGEICLYEWNLMNHYSFICRRTMYDLDGVMCLDPPDERNVEEYEKYIENAVPLFLPTTGIGAIVTYRLEKYRDITSRWLERMGVNYNYLVMVNAEDVNNRGITPEEMKGIIYRENKDYILFVESDDFQARRINEISKKPVYCVSTNKMYN